MPYPASDEDVVSEDGAGSLSASSSSSEEEDNAGPADLSPEEIEARVKKLAKRQASREKVRPAVPPPYPPSSRAPCAFFLPPHPAETLRPLWWSPARVDIDFGLKIHRIGPFH